MDLVRLFMRDEPIAGLSITDKHLRLVLLSRETDPATKKTGVVVKAVSEEPLIFGTIANGEIKNEDQLRTALQNLLIKTPAKITYAILALPQELIYSRIFSFPKTITGEKLEETMRVTVGFNLPNSTADIYLDWEKSDAEKNEILLQSIPQKAAESYISILQSAGLRVVAVESQASSMARVIEMTTPRPILLVKQGEAGASFIILKDRIVRFTNFIPKKFTAEELSLEIKKISDFYESEDEAVVEAISAENIKIAPKFAAHPDMKEQSYRWLAATGAALRGLLPRGEDKLISLMPVGTEKAYEAQKGIVFTKFVSDIAIGISLSFVIAFAGALGFVNFIGSNLSRQLSELASLPLPKDAIALEDKAQRFNNLTAAISEIYRSSPRWSKLIAELRQRAPAGITITGVAIQSAANPFTINGIGRTREQINTFRRILEESPVFTEVKLPITNLQLRTDIPFSMTLRLENPQYLFTK